MAVRVRMGYTSLFDVFFVTGMILFFVIDSIPNTVKYYSELPRFWGIFLLIGFCLFLFRLGKMIVTFVQTYLDMRDLHKTVVLTVKDLHGKMVLGGKMVVDED